MMDKASVLVIGSLERFFYWWGKFVTKHPYPVILSCLLFTAVSSLGFLRFRMEHKASLLWIPPTSQYNTNEAWLDKNFKKNERIELVMFKSENVLTPGALKKMFALHKKVQLITSDGKTFDDICTRVPIADIFQTRRRKKRQAIDEDEDYYDYWAAEKEEYGLYDESITENFAKEEEAVIERINYKKYGSKNNTKNDKKEVVDSLPPNIYCDLVETLNQKCFQTSLLEIWRYKEDFINTVTQQEIIDAINKLTISPWFGYKTEYSSLLGGIERNSSGHIVAATTTQMFWSISIPDDANIVENTESNFEVDLADNITLNWEDVFIDTVLNMTGMVPNAGKSFGDISAGAILFDTWLMAAGYTLMFSYTIFMLGNLNSLEVRLYLSMMGIVGVFMGLAIAMGLSSLLGFPYTPMHGMLPFLCLGIGIDDMFVIVQCWTNLRMDSDTTITEKMGLALQHAGVSVTVTSLTDILAFFVGAISSMPGLQSFCISTAIGLAAIYLLQLSWFVAWMCLDEKRVLAGRDGVLPCIQHPPQSKGLGCTAPWSSSGWTMAKIYSQLLSSNIFRMTILISTVSFFSVGVWGWTLMKMKFDPTLLLPGDSYLREWIFIHESDFPFNGWTAEVYSDTLNYSDLPNIDKLVTDLKLLQEDGGLKDVNSWWLQLKDFAKHETNYSSWQDFATEDKFPSVLSDFLFSAQGSQYKQNFLFTDQLQCKQAAPNISASKFSIQYYNVEEPEEHIPARSAVTNIISDAGSPYTFSHSKIYAAWETDTIIGSELWRNLGMAMVCVFVVTLLLLANIKICVYVMCIVGITLTDIVGFLHFWDITIDVISCVNIVLAIGLCVDYSVHIGLAYMVAKGSRHDKSVEAVASIGPAVFNGGFTTLLAIVLCSVSSSHVFLTFFKVFVLTVGFGLFHGLVLFPVILSLIGPLSPINEEPSQSTSSLTISSITEAATPPSEAIGKVTQSGIANIVFVSEVSRKPSLLQQNWVDHDQDNSSKI